MSYDDKSLLIVSIDIGELAWNNNIKIYNDFVKQLIVFCHSYLLLNRDNKLIILGNHYNHVQQIYSSINKSKQSIYDLSSLLLDNFLLDSHKINNSNDNHVIKSSLSNVLSIALCIINKQVQRIPNLQSRILVIQSMQDISNTYNSVMNSIFSAQRMQVLVDSLIMHKHNSNFMQQASFLTKGIYQHIVESTHILQSLLTYYLPSNKTRQFLNMPLQKTIDFKASCLCHGNVVEFAFMCTVCLTLMCNVSDNCLTCGTPVRKK